MEVLLAGRRLRADFEVNGEVGIEAAHLLHERYAEDDEVTLVLELRNQASLSADLRVEALFKAAEGRAVSHASFSMHDIPSGGRAVDSETVLVGSEVIRIDLVVSQSLND